MSVSSLVDKMPAMELIESAQRHENGDARFRLRAQPEHLEWAASADAEENGGVAAELRIFLDAQLEAGDILIDAAPGFGFVSLSAATAPGGLPSIFALRRDASTFLAMQQAARDVNAFIEPFALEDLTSGVLTDVIVERLPLDGRVFVHADSATLDAALRALAPLVLTGRVAACVLSAPIEPEGNAAQAEAESAARLLDSLGFDRFELREHEGEPRLVPVSDVDAHVPTIAISTAVQSGAGTQSDATHATSTTGSVVVSDSVADGSDLLDIISAPMRTVPFSLIAPCCRTGYGITGAHLLRELIAAEVPFAYFPMGAVDRTIAPTGKLDEVMERQGEFDAQAPSVRLAQQFDLAMHVGRGPRLGFPIFELDLFSAAERHHLQQQDRLLVTCEWARTVLLENGIWRNPIDIVPLGVDRSIFHEHVTPSAPVTHETRFISVGKLERRKGQLELLRAFEAAFKPTDAVRLAFISHNPFVDSKTMEAMTAPFRNSPMAARISLVTTPLPTQRDLAALMASTDCGVFPARAEGWNLEGLEMLSMGKTVIATNATGHTAYMTDRNANLIDIDAFEDATPGEAKGRWAAWGRAQHEQLVEQLRTVHKARQQGVLSVNTDGIATAKRHSWTASAKALMHAVASA